MCRCTHCVSGPVVLWFLAPFCYFIFEFSHHPIPIAYDTFRQVTPCMNNQGFPLSVIPPLKCFFWSMLLTFPQLVFYLFNGRICGEYFRQITQKWSIIATVTQSHCCWSPHYGAQSFLGKRSMYFFYFQLNSDCCGCCIDLLFSPRFY